MTTTPTTAPTPPPAPPQTPRIRTDFDLSRPRQGRWIAGVCAGIADRYGWSRSTVRLVAVLSCLLPGPQFIGYLVLWALMPPRED